MGLISFEEVGNGSCRHRRKCNEKTFVIVIDIQLLRFREQTDYRESEIKYKIYLINMC